MHSTRDVEGYMVKNNSPSPLCIHSQFLSQRQPLSPIFCMLLQTQSQHAFTDMHVWLVGRWGYIIQTVLHLAFVVFQHILKIFLYLFLQSFVILLKGCLLAAYKSSTGDSVAQPGSGATNSLHVKGVQKSFLEILIL